MHQSVFQTRRSCSCIMKLISLIVTNVLHFCLCRQNGLGYCSFMARVGVSVSPLIMLLEEVWGHLPSTIFSLVAVAAGLSASLLPETKNIRLPETIEDVEHTRYWAFIWIASKHSSKIYIVMQKCLLCFRRRSISTSDEKSQP